MSTFLGNHDVARFVSHAAGQIADVWGNGSKQQGWDSPPAQPQGQEPYARLRLAYAFLFSATGIPLIYYGDEIGLAGAGDPDNRRMMSFDGWNAEQQATYDWLGELAKLRAEHPALWKGDTQVLVSKTAQLAIARTLGSDAVVAAFNWAASAEVLVVDVPAALAGLAAVKDALSGESVPVVAGKATMSAPPRSARFLVAP